MDKAMHLFSVNCLPGSRKLGLSRREQVRFFPASLCQDVPAIPLPANWLLVHNIVPSGRSGLNSIIRHISLLVESVSSLKIGCFMETGIVLFFREVMIFCYIYPLNGLPQAGNWLKCPGIGKND